MGVAIVLILILGLPMVLRLVIRSPTRCLDKVSIHAGCPARLWSVDDNGIPDVGSKVQMIPFPRAYANEGTNLDITCTYDGTEKFSYLRVNLNGIDYTLVACSILGTSPDPNKMKISCVNNETLITTLYNIGRDQHNKTFQCSVGTDTAETNKTSLYVRVPVASVSISYAADSSDVVIIENRPSQFECTTSIGRPRATVEWYITGTNGPIQGQYLSPDDVDSLTSTVNRLVHTFDRFDNGSKVYCSAINNDDGRSPVHSAELYIIVYYGTDGPPRIGDFSDGSTYIAIESFKQVLTCSVRGGSPKPTLTWNCFSGDETNITGDQNEIKSRINWRAFRNSHPAKCSCVSNQYVSNQVTTLVVDVLYPPSAPLITVNANGAISGITRIVQDDAVTFHCSSSSNPPSSYEWRNSTSREKTGQDLTFPTIQKDSEGTYTCIARNMMNASDGISLSGQNSSFFTLDVLYPPSTPTFTVGSKTITGKLLVIKLDNVSVTCISSSNPEPPSYQWTGQDAGNSLLINTIQSSVNMTCTANNTMRPSVGETRSGSAKKILEIVVMEAPTSPSLSFIPQNGSAVPLNNSVAVIKGTNFSVICYGSIGYPEPSYSWSGAGSDTPYTISFINIGEPDRGWYTCHVSNNMNRTVGPAVIGENSKMLFLNILYPPQIEIIDNKTLQENERLTLPCNARSNPQPASYIWTRSKDSFWKDSQNLNVQHVTRKDTDLYTCTVENIMEPTVGAPIKKQSSISVAVRVFYFPNVSIYQPTGIDLVEGEENITLVCTADGDPQNFTFKNWRHLAPDGTTLIREYAVSEQIKGQIHLTFQNVSYMDSGFFECSVSNGITDYQTNRDFASSRTIQLVKGHPIVTVNVSQVTAAFHGAATLTASYYSNDGNQQSVQWYRYTDDIWQEISVNDKEFIQNGPDTFRLSFYGVQFYQPGNVSQLLLTNVSSKDFTDYRVNVNNSIGTTFSSTIHLVSEGPPETPKELAVLRESTTSSTITVTWVSGFHGGDDQIFHVQYNTSTTSWKDGASAKGFRLIEVTFSATIHQLSSETQYYFRIFAENSFGRSPYSEKIVTARTRSEAEGPDDSLNVGPIVGGAAGGAVLAAVIGVVILLFRRRRQKYEHPNKRLLKDNKRQPGNNGDDDTPEINVNPMYESAGPLPPNLNNSDVYSQVDKNRKKPKPVGDIYSQVDKPRKRQNSGGSEIKNDVYAQVQKKHLNEQDDGKTKHKKQKPGKKTKKGKQTEGDLYDNVDPSKTQVTKGETVYENPSCSIEDEHTKQLRNQDGLIYADLDLPKEPVGKCRKAVIHGLDDRTDYADIKYGEVGEQAQESDEEDIKKE